MTLRQYIRRGSKILANASIQCADPILHMKQIMEHILETETSQLYLRWDQPLSPSDMNRADQILLKRAKGFPFQYLVGYEWFWKNRFLVGSGVLIPRKETELLLETLLERLSPKACRIAELGPGSGNLGLSALLERSDWNWDAFEISDTAAKYTRKNLQKLLNDPSGYSLTVGDFFEQRFEPASYDALIANPPYVSENEMKSLPIEVTHEPAKALNGGKDGMDILLKLVVAGKKILKKDGLWITEIGSSQSEELVANLKATGYSDVFVLKDYSQHPRIVGAKWTP